MCIMACTPKVKVLMATTGSLAVTSARGKKLVALALGITKRGTNKMEEVSTGVIGSTHHQIQCRLRESLMASLLAVRLKESLKS